MNYTDFGIKHYQLDDDDAQIMRNALLDSEDIILGLGKSAFNYPENQTLGKLHFYNLFVGVEAWAGHGLPFLKRILSDYWQLKKGETVKIKSWANILRTGQSVQKHSHTDAVSMGTVSGNLYLGSDVPTETMFIINGEEVGIPNKFGEFTLFPSQYLHWVPPYEGQCRVAAAFDACATMREKRIWGNMDGISPKVWYNYRVT